MSTTLYNSDATSSNVTDAFRSKSIDSVPLFFCSPSLTSHRVSICCNPTFLIYFLGFITGILWGLYAATILFLYVCVSDPIQPQEMDSNEYSELLEKVKEECIREEHPAQAKIYRGKWSTLVSLLQ